MRVFTSPEEHDRPRSADCLLIFAVVLVSALPYLFGLGFYSDDWDYFWTLDRASAAGIGALFRAMIGNDSHFLFRPVQLAFFVLGFKAFNLHALPYHIVETIFLGAATVFLYLAIGELQKKRLLALTRWCSERSLITQQTVSGFLRTKLHYAWRSHCWEFTPC